MAVDPRLALATQVPDVGRSFSNALLNIQRFEELGRARTEAPIRRRLLESQAATAEAGVPTAQQQLNQADQNKIRSIATVARQIIPDLQAGNVDRVMTTLLNRSKSLSDAGISNNETEEGIALAQSNPNELLRISQEAVKIDDRLTPQRGASARAFAPVTDPETGEVSSTVFDPRTQTFKQVQVPGIKQLTPKQKSELEIKTAGGKEAAKLAEQEKVQPRKAAKIAASKQAIERSGKLFDRLEKVNVNIANYDEVVRLIDEGAETGAVTSLFPSFKAATVALENVQGQLGLDVIGNTTFGALSESELKFALNVALPDKLSPENLRRWAQRKKSVQQKLSRYLSEAANFLGTPGNTIADWNQLQELNQLDEQSPEATQDLGQLTMEQLIEMRNQAQ